MAEVQPNFDPQQIVVESLRTQLLIRTLIKDVRTAIPVKVIAVHPGAGSPPTIGSVDVQPLVQTVDGSGRRWKLGVTYGAQFFRLQAGTTALIVDPLVDDIGLAVVCDRDISAAIASAGLAGPGSSRTHDLSDMLYIGSIISIGAPSQYLQLTAMLLTAVFPNINLNGVTINNAGTLYAPVLQAGNGATGTFVSEDGKTVTVTDGIVTNIT